MKIKFQDELLNTINSFTSDTLPHSIILKGKAGSGKHLICDYICGLFDLSRIDIKDSINSDLLIGMYAFNLRYLYVIDIHSLLTKDQNSLLKVLEDSPTNAYYILIVNDEDILLPTIENRCFKLSTHVYSKEELGTFISDKNEDRELILTLSETPGDIERFKSQNLKGMMELSNKIIDKMKVASFYNALSISDKMAYKNEKSKFDLNIFLSVFKNCLLESLLQEATSLKMSYYNELIKFNKKLEVRNLNMKHLFENFLTHLWQLSRV